MGEQRLSMPLCPPRERRSVVRKHRCRIPLRAVCWSEAGRNEVDWLVPAMTNTKPCRHCGFPNRPESAFCGGCGKPLLVHLVQARNKLVRIVADRGRLIVADRDECGRILDKSKGSCAAEFAVLVRALEAGVPEALANMPAGSAASRLDMEAKLAKELADAGMDHSTATWAVESWALALGVHLGTTDELPEPDAPAPYAVADDSSQSQDATAAVDDPYSTDEPGRAAKRSPASSAFRRGMVVLACALFSVCAVYAVRSLTVQNPSAGAPAVPASQPAPIPPSQPDTPPPPAQPETEPPSPPEKPVARLTEEQLRNTWYDTPSSGKHVKLENGVYEAGSREEGNYAYVGYDRAVFGDLNGDGVDEAAVLMWESGGGSGAFYFLCVVANRQGEPVCIATTKDDFYDRTKVNSVEVTERKVIIDAIVHGENDPLCCPTKPARITCTLVGGERLEVNQE